MVRTKPKTDLETILLYGHLLTEGSIDVVLERNKIKNYQNYSFYRKISLLRSIKFKSENNIEQIISSLITLNNLRNKLAHEMNFDIYNGEFEQWALEIFNDFKGRKFSKYTFKTKIVHSFSALSINILELEK